MATRLCANYPRCQGSTAEYRVTWSDYGLTKTELLCSPCLDDVLNRTASVAYRYLTNSERESA